MGFILIESSLVKVNEGEMLTNCLSCLGSLNGLRMMKVWTRPIVIMVAGVNNLTNWIN